jgi:hypothetical protein
MTEFFLVDLMCGRRILRQKVSEFRADFSAELGNFSGRESSRL